MEESTYRFTIFLMKEEITEYSQCIKAEKNPKYYYWRNGDEEKGVIIISDSTSRKPDWIDFLDLYSNEKIILKANVSNKAALLVKVKNRIMVLTFGYGRSLLKEECIEKNFGLLTALNMLDSKKIRNINAATIEDMVVHTNRQSSYATQQQEFSINIANDIMTSISGKSDDEIWANNVSGKDSLVVSVEMIPTDLEEKLTHYLEAYESKLYMVKGFAWIDNVREVRDSVLKKELDSCFVEKINNKEVDNVFVSPPQVIDWDNIKGIMIPRNGVKKEDVSNYKEEISLVEYLDSQKTEIKIDKLKKDRIWALDNNDFFFGLTSVYSALVAQINYNNNLFVLCDARWYKIESNFYEKVKTYVSNIPISNIDFPTCKNEDEGDYNKKIGTKEGFALMDRKLVGVEGGPKQIEACDIFTRNKQFIHVKKRSKSAQLSHLFAQGKVSAESFVSDLEYRKEVYEKVAECLGTDIFDYSKKPNANEYEVIYAIISDKIGSLEECLPFFSLVNLKMAAEALERMHIKCSVKLIPEEIG